MFTDKSRHLYIWELAGLVTLCFLLLSGVWAEGRQASLAGSLVRLHVLAVSDAPEEQAVKLRVRDAVLSLLAPKLAGVQNADEAGEVLADSLPLIRAVAEQAAEGRPVRVSLGEGDVDCRPYYKADADDWIVKALVASEDGTFWTHCGVRPLSVLRAAVQNILTGRRVSGASTITMPPRSIANFRTLRASSESLSK